MKWLGVDIVYNHADYRLMSKKAMDALEAFPEVNLFLRGIVPLIGLPSDKVYYKRLDRFAGETKYPLKKMLSFAFDGVTSFSIKPIRFISVLGLFIFCLSFVMLAYSLISHFFGQTVMGWSSIIISVWAIGGLQLLSIGVIGEYIGKIYLETKHRPKYIIQDFLK
jgi:glycosyltransferase involved in cell wall biosynthesis